MPGAPREPGDMHQGSALESQPGLDRTSADGASAQTSHRQSHAEQLPETLDGVGSEH